MKLPPEPRQHSKARADAVAARAVGSNMLLIQVRSLRSAALAHYRCAEAEAPSRRMHPHAQDLNSARYLSDGPEAAHRHDVPVHLGDNEVTARCSECLPWIGQVIERRGRQRLSWRQGKGNREAVSPTFGSTDSAQITGKSRFQPAGSSAWRPWSHAE